MTKPIFKTKKIILVVLVALSMLSFASHVNAQGITSAFVVGVSTLACVINSTLSYSGCSETDSGIDPQNAGFITGSFYVLPAGQPICQANPFIDTCTGAIVAGTATDSVAEFVCGSSVAPQYAGYAAVLVMPCSQFGNGWSCLNGRCIAPQPDLVLFSLVPAPSSPTASVSLAITVGNFDGAPSPATVTSVGVCGPPFSLCQQQLLTTPSLAQGQSVIFTVGFTGLTPPGLWTASAFVDPFMQIPELSEANNYQPVSFII